MRLIFTLSLLLTAVLCRSQNCPPNIDFETGDFSHWQCFIGETYTAAGSNVIDLNASGPLTSRHEIITPASTPLLDEFGNFPRYCPYSGSNYSIMLGNKSTGAEAEGISYTFQIPPSADTFSITYFYAVVFENPSHPDPEQPRFFVTAYDVLTGDLIDCASYNYVSTATLPGFQHNNDDTSIIFRDWTPASIDFSGLAGRMVRLEFKTADCTQGGHFGYAYVDVGTGCGGLITVAALCASTNSVVLNAPYGFQSYTWYNGNYSAVVGTTQNVTLSPPPPANSMFHVDMVPFPGFGCRDTADAQVTALPVPDTPVANALYNYCQGDQAQTLSATANIPNAILWYTTPTGGAGDMMAPRPSTAVSGTFHYYVVQKVLFGCESERVDVVVNVSPTPVTTFSVNDDRQCQETNNFIFNNTTNNITSSAIYEWDFGDGELSALRSPTHRYVNYGSYTVKLKVLNPPVCSKEITDQLVVVAAPVADFTYTQVVCEQQTPIVLTDASSVPGNTGSINGWQWTVGSSTYNVRNPNPFLRNAGNLPIKLVVTTADGCGSAAKEIVLPVHYRPAAKFKYGGAFCDNEVMVFTDQSAMPAAAAPDYVNAWSWMIDNTVSSTVQNPGMVLPAGMHHVKLFSESNIGCKSLVADSAFMMYGKPNTTLAISDSCNKRSIKFDALDHGTYPVVEWLWNFGDGLHTDVPTIYKIYPRERNNPITLISKTIHGCKDTILRPFKIYENHAFAGRDTIAAMAQAVQLDAGGADMLYYNWSPSFGLNDPGSRNPVATLNTNQLYELKTMSIYGCDAYSKIYIERYKGPELYVPTAFSPNRDGNNDLLKVFAVGIKSFYSFAVFNRNGVQLFNTTDHSKGWDGTYKSVGVDPGTYVVYARALDYRGNVMLYKGTVVLLR